MKLSNTYNLKVLYPEIAIQWHPNKNGDLTPDKVAPGSDRRVWWICARGHEWETKILVRTRGCGCPRCGSNTATKEHNLMILRPDIADQWHPEKNGFLTPEDVTPVSKRKVWWECSKGHEWMDVIRARTKYNNGCPYCNGIDGYREYNLSSLHPDIAEQWHPTKNGALTPEDVTPCSDKKVWWVCSKGHEWQATVHERSIQGNGCPYCAGKRASKEYNFLKMYPEIAREWHPKKNRDLTPDKVTPVSGKKVWWVCDKGHEWQTTICERSSGGSGCPYCAGSKASKEYNLLKIYPEITRQWHPVKNGQLTPDKVTPGSNKKVWWVCAKGHEWEATIGIRTRIKSPCPFCSRKKASKEYSLSVFYPEIARQWHPVKNGQLTPDKVTPGSKKKVWWLCAKGHEWEAAINSKITNKNRCPLCSRIKASKEYNLSVVCPEVARQWHPTKNRDLTPDNVTPGSSRKVWWQCDKGHEWQAVIGTRYYKRSGCPYCAGRRKR